MRRAPSSSDLPPYISPVEGGSRLPGDPRGLPDHLTEIRASLGPPRGASARPLYSPSEMQLKTDHNNGKKNSEYNAALQKIRKSLQPYFQASDGSPGNYDTLSSESSSGTNGSDHIHLESEMLQQLVSMGFDQEASWYALKLTQFRGIATAVEILLKIQSSAVFDHSDQKNGPRKQSYENGLDSGSSRSESPRIPSPSGPYLPSTRSALAHSSHQAGVKRSLHLQEVSMVNGGGNVTDYSLQQSLSPVVHAVSSKRVEKPRAQTAISPTVINVLPERTHRPAPQSLNIHVQPQNTSEFQLPTLVREPPKFQTSTASIQRIPIDDSLLDPSCPTDKRYIDYLCQRVSNLLGGAPSPPGKRESTASSTGSEPGESQEPSFAALLQADRQGRSSPVSSLSTESSTESVGFSRSESPIPDSLLERLNGQQMDSSVKPCTPKAFKFYMEQHIENVIKQHKERQDRYWTLEHELETARFDSPTREQMRQLLVEKESRHLRYKRQRITESMFEKMSTIGVGAFGEVALVRKKDTKLLYAMKILKKSDIIKRNQAAHVKAERDILSEADNEWVVKLYYSFQDPHRLYFIMEYIPGGDMMSLLIKKGIFEEELARFYIAELVCAIESVHRLGFIHRDIKPDNILIDKDGHIKLTDFGLCTGLRWTHDNKYYHPDEETLWNAVSHAKQDSYEFACMKNPSSLPKLLEHRHKRTRQKAHSLVGTPNYIAPEVLMRTGHTQLCDWWSVGVICFEMVVGYPPFLANSPLETQYKVIHWKETLMIPREAKLASCTEDFILSLCCGTDKRMGHTGAHEVKSHPYFKSVPLDTLRQSGAPYKPQILNETDTSNFDPVESRPDSPGVERTRKEHSEPQGNGVKKEHTFYEFTFRRFFDSDPMGCPTIRGTPPPRFQQRPSLGPLMESNISILRINTGSEPPPPDEYLPCTSSNASTLVEEESTEQEDFFV